MNTDYDSMLTVHRCRFIHYLSSHITSMSLNIGITPNTVPMLAVLKQNNSLLIYTPTISYSGSMMMHVKRECVGEAGLECIEFVRGRLFGGGLGGIVEWDLNTGN